MLELLIQSVIATLWLQYAVLLASSCILANGVKSWTRNAVCSEKCLWCRVWNNLLGFWLFLYNPECKIHVHVLLRQHSGIICKHQLCAVRNLRNVF